MTVASIDIGTNTILLLIADVNLTTRKIKVLKDLHRIPRIGKGLKDGNPFPGDNIIRMFEVLTGYSEIIKKFNCEKVVLTGTNAFRIASDKNEIVDSIKSKFGYELNVITGEEEARYSYLGATSSFNDSKKYLVIDIGGGSTEIIYGNNENIVFSKSFNAGVVSGTENFLNSNPPTEKQVKEFTNHINKVFSGINTNDIDTAIAIAGTPTTLAAIKHKLKSFDENIIEGTALTYNEINVFVDELSKLGSEEILNKYSQIVKGREDILLAGTIILREVLRLLNIEAVKVSTKGIRYGAIINWLSSNRGI